MNDDVSLGAPSLPLASGRMRILAYAIDAGILYVAAKACEQLLLLGHVTLPGAYFLFFTLFSAVYFIGFHQSKWQATPGKKLLKMRLVSIAGNGTQVDINQAATRYMIVFAGIIVSLLMAIAMGKTLDEKPIEPLQPSPEIKTFAQVQANVDNEPTPEDADVLQLRAISNSINEKQRNNEPLSEEEQDYIDLMRAPNYSYIFTNPDEKLMRAQILHTLMEKRIERKKQRSQVLSISEKAYLEKPAPTTPVTAWLPNGPTFIELLTLLYTIAIVFSVLGAPQRTSFHDRICKTLVIRA